MNSGLQHAGEILDLFTSDAPEWGPTGVAHELGIAKSHAHRLLSTLSCLGLLERQSATRRYRLGWRPLSLAAVVFASDDLLSRALPAMRELGERTGAAVSLALLERGRVLCIRASNVPALARLS